jgi:hypothetical protein
MAIADRTADGDEMLRDWRDGARSSNPAAAAASAMQQQSRSVCSRRGSAGSAPPTAAPDSQHPRSAAPLLAGDFVLDLPAIAAGHQRLWRLAGKGADVSHPDAGHHRTRWAVDRKGLGEDTTQTDVHEAIAQQCVRALAGQPLPPPSTQQTVAEIGLARDLALIGAVRRLKHPTTDELSCVEPDPDSKTGNLFPSAQSAAMGLVNFRSGERATIEVAENLRIGIELDLELKMLIVERGQLESARVQYRSSQYARSLSLADHRVR